MQACGLIGEITGGVRFSVLHVFCVLQGETDEWDQLARHAVK